MLGLVHIYRQSLSLSKYKQLWYTYRFRSPELLRTHCNWSSSVALLCSLCVGCRALTIFHFLFFLENYEASCYQFWSSISMVIILYISKIMAYYPWSLMGRANMQKRQQFKKNLLLYSHTLEKTNGMVMIPMNCEIHNPWVRSSEPRVGPMWPYSKMY